MKVFRVVFARLLGCWLSKGWASLGLVFFGSFSRASPNSLSRPASRISRSMACEEVCFERRLSKMQTFIHSQNRDMNGMHTWSLV